MGSKFGPYINCPDCGAFMENTANVIIRRGLVHRYYTCNKCGSDHDEKVTYDPRWKVRGEDHR